MNGTKLSKRFELCVCVFRQLSHFGDISEEDFNSFMPAWFVEAGNAWLMQNEIVVTKENSEFFYAKFREYCYNNLFHMKIFHG